MIIDEVFYKSLGVNSLFLILFILSLFFAFYIPGKVILGNFLKKFEGEFQKLTICLATGMILWVLQGLIFGYLHLRFLSYLYLLIFFLLWKREVRYKFSFPKIWKRARISKYNIILAAIFIIGIFGQNIQFFITGFTFSSGIHSAMAGADDSVWHTSIISEIIRRFPPHQPGLAGILAHNYHFLTDLLIAELIRVFHLPLLATQFQYASLFFSFILGSLAYVLGKTLKLSKFALLFVVYLMYFSSDVIYFLAFIRTRIFEFTVHPLEDGTMLLENPPRALSYIAFLGGTIFFFYFLRNKDFKTGFIAALFFGLIIGFKVQTALGVLFGLGMMTIYFLIKKEIKMIWMPVLAVVVSLLVHIPINKVSGLPIFVPYEMARMFAVQPKLHISNFELARRIYLDHSNFLQAIRMDITMLIIFLASQFGIRFIGLIPTRIIFKTLKLPLTIFLVSSSLGFFILGTFFYQPIGGADIFNFYLAMGIVLSLLASINMGWMWSKSPILLKVLIIVVIVSVTMPRWVYKTASAIKLINRGPLIASKEIDAFEFIEKNTNPNSIILVSNHGQWDSRYPYVEGFTKRDTFLSGMNILDGHGISYKDRQEIVSKIFTSKNKNEVRNLLTENKIDILYYYYPISELSKGLNDLEPRKIFSNSIISVYKIK